MLEREQPAAPVEPDAYRIEPQLGRPRPLEPPLTEPLPRHRPDLPPLARPDADERPEPIDRPVPHDPRLHLTEDEKPRTPRNDVELPEPGPEIPLDDLKPPRLEMPRSQLLTTSTEPPPGIVRHAGDRTPAIAKRGAR